MFIKSVFLLQKIHYSLNFTLHQAKTISNKLHLTRDNLLCMPLSLGVSEPHEIAPLFEVDDHEHDEDDVDHGHDHR